MSPPTAGSRRAAEPRAAGETISEVEAGSIDTVIVALADMHGRLVGKRTTGRYFAEHAEHGIDVLQLAPDARHGVRRDAGLRHLEPRPRLRGLPATPGSRHSATHSLARGDGARALRSQLVRRHARRAVAAVHPGTAGRAGSRGRLRAPHQLGARVLPLPRELRGGACERVHEAEPVLPVRDRRAPARPRLRRAVHPPATRGDGVPPEFRSRRPRRRRGPASTSSRSATATRSPRATITSSTSMGRRRSPSRTAARSRSWPSRIIAWFGSSCHIHTSLWQGGRNAFEGESELCRHFLAGQLAGIRELALFVAPNVNSYKRFYGGVNWAGNTITWAHDNRTTGFRVVGHGSSFRVEARIPGADCNPYLAYRGPAGRRASTASSASCRSHRRTRATPTPPSRPSASRPRCVRQSRRSSKGRWRGPPSATTSSITT